MNQHIDLYQKNLLALAVPVWQVGARIRRRWYRESTSNFATTEDYVYDASGQLAQTVEDGPWFQCRYGYDEHGRVVRRTHAPVDPSDPNPPTIDEYSYDDAGRVTRKTVSCEELTTESTFEFDETGRLSVEHERHLSTGDGASTDHRFYYDGAGRLRLVEQLSSRGAWGVRTYHYDAHERPVLLYERGSYGTTTVASFEYVENTPAGDVLHNEGFAVARQPLEDLAPWVACDGATLSKEQRSIDGVDLGRDLEEKVVTHLRTGCYGGHFDAASDWLERVVKAQELAPVIKRRLIDALHRCLTHADPTVRVAAVRALETSPVLRDDRQFVLRVLHHWELFAGLRLPDDNPSRDRGQDAVRILAARANAVDEGMEFVRRMALDATYGLHVLAALVQHDPEWVVGSVERLVAPDLDPRGLRLSVVFSNLKHDAQRLARVVTALRGRLADERLNAALAELGLAAP